MARMYKSDQVMTLGVKLQTVFEDGSVADHVFKIGDVIENMRYVNNGAIDIISGKLVDVKYTTPSKITWNKNKPSNSIVDDLQLTNLVIDASSQYESKVVTVPLMEVVEWEDETNVARMKFEPSIAYTITMNYSDNTQSTVSVEVGDEFDNVAVFNPNNPSVLIQGSYKVVGFAYKLVNKQIVITGIGFQSKDDDSYLVTDFNYVFKMNEVYRREVSDAASLTEALAELANGDTLVVSKPVSTVGNQIKVFEKDVALEVNADVAADSSHSAGLQVAAGGKVELSGTGKFTTNTPYDSTHSTGVIVARDGGEIVFNGSGVDAVIEDDPVNKGQYAIVALNGSKVTFNDGEVKAGYYSISTNGTNVTQMDTIVINGGKLISVSDYSLYLASLNTTTINDGVIDGGAGAIAINRGKLIINGGTLQSFGNGDTGTATDGTGGLSNAVLYLNAKYGDVECVITGGTFKASGDAVLIASGANHNVSISISGGKFNRPIDESWIASGFKLTDEPDTDGFYEVVPDVA